MKGAANELLAFLKTSNAIAVMKKQGMEPGSGPRLGPQRSSTSSARSLARRWPRKPPVAPCVGGDVRLVCLACTALARTRDFNGAGARD